MTSVSEHIVVFVTAKDAGEGQAIVGKLLDEKLVACANLLSKVESFFWWEGKTDRADEVLLVLKSRMELLEKITAAVKATHSYDVPEVLALPIIGGNKEYLKWIDESVSGS